MNPATSQFLNFFVELVLRLRSKSPKFFRILQNIFGYSFLITGLPGVIQFVANFFGAEIVLPEVWNEWIVKIAGWVTAIGLFLSSLPVETPTVATAPVPTLLSSGNMVEAGTPLKATDPLKLPFTATAEAKAVEKEAAKDAEKL